jgi:two-component system NtrC family sensor kinase
MRHIAPNDSRASEGMRNALFSSRAGAASSEVESRREAVLATVLESVECGILLIGLGGELWAVNDRLAEILGVQPERLREMGSLEQFVEKLAPQFAHGDSVAARWRQRFRNGEVSWEELELVKPEKKILERRARPVLDHYKQPLGWLEVYRDISSQRQIQSRLFHSERLASLGQMVSGVAHELNNALTSIIGYAQLVQRRSRGFEWEVQGEHILAEAERAKRISRNLLLFARGSKSERGPVNINEVVERTLEIRAYELRLENIRVELDLYEQLPQARADAAQIQQALLNLVVNAEQAIRQTKESGHIWIRTRQIPENRIALEVADDGPGVPPEVILRIFDPFFTTKPAGVGTGLGLSILYGIVHQHGGEVSVENRPGGGAVFTLELPGAPSSYGSKETTYLTGLSSTGDQASPGAARGSRILVVEDEPTVARLIADVLSEEGHSVETVLDSRDGLELAQAGHYDLVICDLRMPHLDGRAFYRQLLRSENSLQHKLIFVTGDTLAPRTVDFLQKCGLPYLAKPFLVEELKEVVGRTLGQTNSVAGNPTANTEPKAPGGYEQADGRDWNEHEL